MIAMVGIRAQEEKVLCSKKFRKINVVNMIKCDVSAINDENYFALFILKNVSHLINVT